MPTIRLVASDAQHLLEPLCDLLIDIVHSGGGVGFLAPLARDTARRYWQQLLASAGNALCLWVAEIDNKVVGSVQLVLCEKENGRHRGEIQKLLVLRSHRGQGIASRLMTAAESHARGCGRTLLVLDTQIDSYAEIVYRHLGWQKAGEIPDYAASPDGVLHATVVYYKQLVP